MFGIWFVWFLFYGSEAQLHFVCVYRLMANPAEALRDLEDALYQAPNSNAVRMTLGAMCVGTKTRRLQAFRAFHSDILCFLGICGTQLQRCQSDTAMRIGTISVFKQSLGAMCIRTKNTFQTVPMHMFKYGDR